MLSTLAGTPPCSSGTTAPRGRHADRLREAAALTGGPVDLLLAQVDEGDGPRKLDREGLLGRVRRALSAEHVALGDAAAEEPVARSDGLLAFELDPQELDSALSARDDDP